MRVTWHNTMALRSGMKGRKGNCFQGRGEGRVIMFRDEGKTE